MAETPTQQTVTPPATSGGTSDERIAKIAAEAAAAIAAAIRPITEKLGAMAESQKKAVTAETIGKTVADAIEARSTAQAANQARTEFVAANLKNVPRIYADKLGADAGKWAEEARAIRESYLADLKAMGIQAPAVGSDAPGATGTMKPGDIVDTTKLSGIQLIELGVKQSSVAVPISSEQLAATTAVKAA